MALIEVLVFLVPICVAFVFGILIGWAWKPKWAIMGSDKLSCFVSKAFDSSFPSSPLASVMSPLKGLRSKGSEAWTLNTGEDKTQSSATPNEYEDCRYLRFIGFSLFSLFFFFFFGIILLLFFFFFFWETYSITIWFVSLLLFVQVFIWAYLIFVIICNLSWT